jgi:hypothetical protein
MGKVGLQISLLPDMQQIGHIPLDFIPCLNILGYKKQHLFHAPSA